MGFKLIKVRLYPTEEQKKMLEMHFNAYRFCYNLCLEYRSFMWDLYKINKSKYDMQAELFEIMKTTDWLKDCKVECLREAVHQVDKNVRNFFKGKGYPKFKTKKTEKSFPATQAIYSIGGKIKFFGNYIKYKDSEKYIELLESNKIKRIAFKKDKVGDYWASCLIEIPVNIDEVKKSDSIIGLDLGLKDLIITSEGVKYANNKYLINSELKEKKLKRKFAKTKKGSKNREKLRVKVAKLYRKTCRQKEHYYHQITNELIRDNQTIVIETLDIQNMIKNHKLSRGISDASWGIIIHQLIQKSKWYDRELIRIDRFYPSSKTCSNCGSVKGEIKLSERVYKCENCGIDIDRDINAAINIRNAGLKIPGVSAEGVGCEPIETESNSLTLTI